MADKKHYVFGLLPLFDLLKSRSLELEPVLKKHGVDPDAMTGDTVVQQRTELRILKEVMEQLEEPLLGLEIGDRLNIEYYGVYALMVMSAPSVMEAVNVSARFQGLSFMFSQLSIHYFDDYIEGRLMPPKVNSQMKNPIVDRDLAGTNRFLQLMSPKLHQYTEYGLGRPRPDKKCLNRYFALFKGSVRFDQGYSWFRLSKSAAAVKMPNSNPLAYNLYKSQCQMLLNQMYPLSEDIGSQIRYQLNSYEGALPRIDEMAKMFSMTERTLRRRLVECGTSYSEMIDQARKDRAMEYLIEHRLSVNKVADLLGYASSVSFLAAFKRWTNTTPKKYIQSVEGAASIK